MGIFYTDGVRHAGAYPAALTDTGGIVTRRGVSKKTKERDDMTVQYHVKSGSEIKVLNAKQVEKLKKHKNHIKVLFWTIEPDKEESIH